MNPAEHWQKKEPIVLVQEAKLSHGDWSGPCPLPEADELPEPGALPLAELPLPESCEPELRDELKISETGVGGELGKHSLISE